jgi:tRNA dimethylallyltransferase
LKVGSRLPLVVLAGATATGKSALAMALAERFPVEIISADSAQVYTGMDIGTAKPGVAERARVPHHLIDCCDPADPYSAARFADAARPLIDAIRARHRLPVVVGGTMLYLKALLEGLSALPPQDPELRRQLRAERDALGAAALHARLQTLDPERAAALHPNDWHRVQRALEIHAKAGSTVQVLHQTSALPDTSGPQLCFQVTVADRAELHARIEQRFHQMMAQGFLDEVATLYRRGDLHPELPSIRSAGYRQLWPVCADGAPVDAAVMRGIYATRQLAKRQLTWLRRMPDWIPLEGQSAAQLNALLARLAPFLPPAW